MINKIETSPKAGHEQTFKPGAAEAPSPAHGAQEVESDVKDLTARVDDLEQRVGLAPPVPAQSPSAGAIQPPPGPTSLQDVLPQIKDLAEKVGGLEHLSEIIDNLKQPKG